jgi:lipopolysaccharide transport system ATP-binding protein
MSSRDLTLDVRHVSKRYCRNLKRSMWYGVRDLCTEIVGGSHEGHRKLRPGAGYFLPGRAG